MPISFTDARMAGNPHVAFRSCLSGEVCVFDVDRERAGLASPGSGYDDAVVTMPSYKVCCFDGVANVRG